MTLSPSLGSTQNWISSQVKPGLSESCVEIKFPDSGRAINHEIEQQCCVQHASNAFEHSEEVEAPYSADDLEDAFSIDRRTTFALSVEAGLDGQLDTIVCIWFDYAILSYFANLCDCSVIICIYTMIVNRPIILTFGIQHNQQVVSICKYRLQ